MVLFSGPAGRSGCVTTPTTGFGPFRSSTREAAATSGVPINTMRMDVERNVALYHEAGTFSLRLAAAQHLFEPPGVEVAL